jgi:hypothetical protein
MSAFKTLQEWLCVAEDVLKQEFPSWHLLACFDVFHLSEHGQKTDVKRSLEKLGKAFRVSDAGLKEQYQKLLPIALSMHKQGGLPNRDAWKEAYARTRPRNASQGKYYAPDLFEVLAAYMAWTSSSSGVEQQFSKVKRSPVELSSSAADTDRRMAIVMGEGSNPMPVGQQLLKQLRTSTVTFCGQVWHEHDNARDSMQALIALADKGLMLSGTEIASRPWTKLFRSVAHHCVDLGRSCRSRSKRKGTSRKKRNGNVKRRLLMTACC